MPVPPGKEQLVSPGVTVEKYWIENPGASFRAGGLGGTFPYLHRSRMTWVNILALTMSSSMTANSSAPCIRLSVPGMAQPKATPPSMSWT